MLFSSSNELMDIFPIIPPEPSIIYVKFVSSKLANPAAAIKVENTSATRRIQNRRIFIFLKSKALQQEIAINISSDARPRFCMAKSETVEPGNPNIFCTGAELEVFSEASSG